MTDPDKDSRKEKNNLSVEHSSNLKSRLDELDKKLEKVRKNETKGDSPRPKNIMNSYAFRIASEFITGPLVGGFLGWWLDNWFNTLPLFFLILLMLGFAAGVINVMRTAKLMQEERKQRKYNTQ